MRLMNRFKYHPIWHLILFPLAVLFISFLSPINALAINIPLTVQEALPLGINGMARSSETVTVGIPLEENSGITSISQLGLSGTSMGQFRELARWPNGNIKWVLADFQSDVPANGTNMSVSLANGTGNSGGSNLATDNGSNLIIDTGPAQFVVKKANFNIFDKVTINGQILVSSGSDGFLLRDASNLVYTSSNDSLSTALVEENGPLHAVIKAEGRFKSSTGSGHMWYTLRLHFYKDKSYVKVYATMRNADATVATTQIFNSTELVIPLSLGSTKQFEFARKTDAVSGALDGTAYLYQAFSTDKLGGDWSYWDQWEGPISRTGGAYNFVQKGLEINNNGVTLNNLGNQDDWTRGWAELRDSSGKGLTVAVRWMSALWPAGFDVSANGTFRSELYSRHNSKTGLKFAWGAYDTREIMFDFHTTSIQNEAVLYRLQYPILARAPLSQYAKSGAFYGETKLATAQEQNNWFLSKGMTPDDRKWPSTENRVASVWRYWDWPQGSGSNQMDFALADLIDYIRTGNGGFFLNGEQQSIYKADSAIQHSDRFDYTTNPVNSDRTGTINGKTFDRGHCHWISLPILYYMTGNELIRESIIDYGEDFDQRTANNTQIRVGSQWEDTRIWSRTLRNFSLLYEFTKDPKYLSILTNMTDMMLASRDNPPNLEPYGRNMERGYMWLVHGGSFPTRQLSDFMLVQIHYEAVWESLRVLKTFSYPKIEEIEDYLLGLGQFIYNEMYFEKNGGTPLFTSGIGYNYGYLYDYALDSINTPAGNSTITASYPYLRPISSGRPMTYLYELTGDPKYLEREGKLLVGDMDWVTPRTASETKSQAFILTDLKRSTQEVIRTVAGVTATNNGGGSYSLSWTVPDGAVSYKIKYSDKPIVEWLGFNQSTRAYQFDPASYTPFFAALNISNEPAPSLAGTQQSYTINNLDAGKTWYFSIKYLAKPTLDTLPPKAPTGLIVR